MTAWTEAGRDICGRVVCDYLFFCLRPALSTSHADICYRSAFISIAWRSRLQAAVMRRAGDRRSTRVVTDT